MGSIFADDLPLARSLWSGWRESTRRVTGHGVSLRSGIGSYRGAACGVETRRTADSRGFGWSFGSLWGTLVRRPFPPPRRRSGWPSQSAGEKVAPAPTLPSTRPPRAATGARSGRRRWPDPIGVLAPFTASGSFEGTPSDYSSAQIPAVRRR
jgi:hypothetical protein